MSKLEPLDKEGKTLGQDEQNEVASKLKEE